MLGKKRHSTVHSDGENENDESKIEIKKVDKMQTIENNYFSQTENINKDRFMKSLSVSQKSVNNDLLNKEQKSKLVGKLKWIMQQHYSRPLSEMEDESQKERKGSMF
jgi:hypothetical protein